MNSPMIRSLGPDLRVEYILANYLCRPILSYSVVAVTSFFFNISMISESYDLLFPRRILLTKYTSGVIGFFVNCGSYTHLS